MCLLILYTLKKMVDFEREMILDGLYNTKIMKIHRI